MMRQRGRKGGGGEGQELFFLCKEIMSYKRMKKQRWRNQACIKEEAWKETTRTDGKEEVNKEVNKERRKQK